MALLFIESMLNPPHGGLFTDIPIADIPIQPMILVAGGMLTYQKAIFRQLSKELHFFMTLHCLPAHCSFFVTYKCMIEKKAFEKEV